MQAAIPRPGCPDVRNRGDHGRQSHATGQSPNGVSVDVLEPAEIVTKAPSTVPITPSDSDAE